MIWLAWRQLRVGALSVLAAVVVTAGVLLVADRTTGHIDLDSTGPLFSASALVVYALPAVIGVFWGVPTVTRELENGTHNLVWNQTVTRNRWLAAKLGVGVLAAVLVAGLLSLVVSWWATPVDALRSERFSGGSFPLRTEPLLFGARGIVPIGYAVFAFVLGGVIGMLLRRTVPAMAVTLVLFTAVQVAVPLSARPHVLPATEETVAITASNIWQIRADEDGVLESLTVTEPAGAWVLANETVDRAGNTVSPLPAAMRNCLPPPPGEYDEAPSRRSIAECVSGLSGLGYRQHLSYQPAGRFWPLQWAETALFLVLSASLTWFCFRRLHRLT